jgi:glycosyltransferase involved in cell wall biosynthesis
MVSEIWIHALGAKRGGSVTYLRAVVPELVRHLDGKGIPLTLLLPSPWDGAPLPPWFEARALPDYARSPASRLVFDHLVLPRWLARRSGAVLYCSGSFSPFRKSAPTIALLRNAIYFDEGFLLRERPSRRRLLRLQRVLITRAARTCFAVHYPSRSMRDLVEANDARLEPVGFVNSYGVGMQFASARTVAGRPTPTVGRPTTFLYVMNYTLQKNFTLLLQALARARAERLPIQVLVTSRLDTGPPASFEADRALIARERLIESGYLVAVGPTYGDALIDLYRKVDACVFPSVCESFGHPLVEALALGKPLVCSDRPFARELCTGHAVYVDPDRPDDLVQVWRQWPAPVGRVPPMPLGELLGRFSWRTHVAHLVDALLDAPR